jgi:hypothetical protein
MYKTHRAAAQSVLQYISFSLHSNGSLHIWFQSNAPMSTSCRNPMPRQENQTWFPDKDRACSLSTSSLIVFSSMLFSWTHMVSYPVVPDRHVPFSGRNVHQKHFFSLPYLLKSHYLSTPSKHTCVGNSFSLIGTLHMSNAQVII